jgi:heptosyltransferase-2
MATPLLRAIHQAWPNTKLLLVGRPAHHELFVGLPGVEGYRGVPSAFAVGEEARLLRKSGASTILLLPNSLSSALAAKLARIPHRIGRKRHGRGLLLNRRLPRQKKPMAMTTFYLDWLKALGIEDQERKETLAVAAPKAPHTPIPQDVKLLAVAPGAAYGPSKLLPISTLAAALRELRDQHDFVPVLLGSPHESELLEGLATQVGAPCFLPAPSLRQLGESSAILARSALFLGSDAGARHLASAHGIPQVVWYGPTDLTWSAHDLERMEIVRQDGLDCLGCQRAICPKADHPCMSQIEAKQVVDAVLRAARKNPKAKALG